MNLPAVLRGLQDLAAPDALDKVGKLLPRVVTVALVAVIAWQLATLTWLLVPRKTANASMPTAAVSPTIPAASGQFNAQKIADSHLFGLATAADSAGDIANAPQTQIPLVLTGTIATGDPLKGFAFIGESAALAKFLKVGDRVGGMALLHSVYPDRVMLDRAGRLEALLLPRQGALLASRPPPPLAPTPTRFGENLKRIAETNPGALSEIVRPQPVFAGGVQQGFRVYPGRNRQAFAKLGLQPGDLVKAINGTPLDDPQRSQEIFNTLSASDRAQLTVERNGQIQQINLNTSQISLPDPEQPAREAGMPPQELRARDPLSREPDGAEGPAGRVLLDPNGAEIQ